MFDCHHARISPDLMCLSKGITAGYMPMSVVMTSKDIYDAFYGDFKELKVFLHSHTYAGNVLYFLPPYVINEEEISFMVNVCFDSIDEYFRANMSS